MVEKAVKAWAEEEKKVLKASLYADDKCCLSFDCREPYFPVGTEMRTTIAERLKIYK